MVGFTVCGSVEGSIECDTGQLAGSGGIILDVSCPYWGCVYTVSESGDNKTRQHSGGHCHSTFGLPFSQMSPWWPKKGYLP